jgi:ribosome maturation factor RimP
MARSNCGLVGVFVPTLNLSKMTIQQSLDPKLSRLHELAQKAADPLELTVLDVKVGQQGKRRSVEICLFKKSGFIGLEECEKVSRDFEALVDAPEYQSDQSGDALLTGSYVLEVVSPGIERELTSAREFAIFAGQKVKVKCREKFGDFGCDFIATLLGGDGSQIKLTDLVAFDPNKTISKKGNQKAKASKKKEVEPELPSNLLVAETTDAQVAIDLAKLLRVNLYADDLKGNSQP